MACEVGPGDLRWRATCKRRTQVANGTSWEWKEQEGTTFPALFRSVRPEAVTYGEREREHRTAEIVARYGVDARFDDVVQVEGQPRPYRVIGVEYPYKGRYRRWVRLHLGEPDGAGLN